MTELCLLGLMAQATSEGNPVIGFLVLAGLAVLGFAIFGGKKSKYLVSHSTSVRKMK